MGIKAFRLIIFLMGLFFCSGTLVRVSYNGSNLSSPEDLQFLKQNNASHIRINDEKHGLLRRVCLSNIDVDLYTSIKTIVAISKSRAVAVAWVHREVSSFINCINISTIIVSGELMTENHFPLLLPTLKAIDSALTSLKLDRSIKLSASFSLSFIEDSFIAPSKLSSPNSRDVLLQVVDFLRVSRSFMTVTAFCGDKMSFGDCLISVKNRTTAVLPSDDLPLRINLRNLQHSSFMDRVAIDKSMSGIGKQDSSRLLSLFVEKPLIIKVEHKEMKHEEESLQFSCRELIGSKVQSVNSTPQLDVITPLATVPVTNPTSPVVNPFVSPATPTTTPITSPTTTPLTTSPASSGQSWCIASQTASETALQVALDYACGYGGADCSAIRQGGSCYEPNTFPDHSSYAFNNYYQKNPVATSCNFGGTAVLTNIDPSKLCLPHYFCTISCEIHHVHILRE
eukprot:TRINITY_DN12319_c0_g1_i8.p1 TRINITY_DN12319_c0_g1~~TRINITY_DN12319_c0_g1_i8.p1  ORF type:complete len:453 (-),score=56.28 TRINITY_DN12319_c0_g1_i8:732-2090(-)